MRDFFPSSKTICKCGCETNNFSNITKQKLNLARKLAGIPFVLTSACRCIKHNKKEGGGEDSAHISTLEIECEAVDIRAVSSRSRFLIVDALIKAGFTRIGIDKEFIHADTSETKSPQVFWLY